jgi:hypothetical protein
MSNLHKETVDARKIMTTIHNSAQHKLEVLSQSGSWWRQVLLLVIGLGLFLLLALWARDRPPADKPGNPVARQSPAAVSQSGSAPKPSRDF